MSAPAVPLVCRCCWCEGLRVMMISAEDARRFRFIMPYAKLCDPCQARFDKAFLRGAR